MTWWAWVAVFVVLLVGSAAVLFVLVRTLWRKAVLLFGELDVAATRIDELTTQLEALETGPPAGPAGAPGDDLAVFARPADLRSTAPRRRR